MISPDFTSSDRAHLVRFVNSFVRNRDAAEDIAHDALLRAQRSQFRGESTFTTWLYKIAHNLCVDHYRRSRVEAANEFPELIESVEASPVRCAMHQQIRRAIQDLNAEDRIAITEKFYEGLTIKEMADKHGLTVQVQKSRIYRALGKLRKRLMN